MSQLKGSGGKPKTPPTPTTTPDNLRSEDTVEVVLGITEGPWKGLVNGAKSFNVGDTVLERQDGGRNFEEFEVKTYPGDAFPDPLQFKLGGAASNNQVGVSLAYGVPLTRQTESGNIDAIDVRLVVQQLFKSVEGGKNPGIFDNTFEFKIRYKPLSGSTWAEWYGAVAQQPGTANPYVGSYPESWSEDSYQDGGGVWHDPYHPDYEWFSGNFMNAVNWYKDNVGEGSGDGGQGGTVGTLRIRGKTTSTYVKEYRIPVQRIPEPYLVQVERISADSSLSGDPKYIAEVMWESFQEIDTTPKRYPYTGFIQVSGRATDQFTSVPQFSGEGDGMIVKVPTNFDPETRVYTGAWDGQWKEAWTNSPVWLLYEAIHNDRWGWSAYSPVTWSRYEAYALAQITDHILPSGKPRYTFNAYLTDPMDGREFCRYMAGSFNSIIVDDDNGNVQVLMDKDDPAVGIFGPESIVGDFEYTFTDVNTRYNDITVVFRNPEIDYNEDRRGIKDDDQIAQFGRVPFDFVAVGTTDANEAVRKASRRLVSATTETEMVNFRTNRKAQNFAPYDIILITDPYKGYGISGRFKSYVSDTVTLRDPVYLETGVTYGLEIDTADGVVSRTIVGATTGWHSTLTLNLAIPVEVSQKAQFSLTQDGGGYGLPKPYRILNINLNEDPDDWSIMAIEVNRLKFAAEDDAEIVGEPRYSFPIKKEPEAPENVLITNMSRAAPDGTMIYEARVDFTPPVDPYTNRYFIRYRQVGETEYQVVETDGTGLIISLPRDGDWEFQVQSRNIWEQQSPWVSPLTPVTEIDKSAAIVGGDIVGVFGGVNQIRIEVTYPSDQPDLRYAQIWVNTVNNYATATYLGKSDSTTYIHTGLTGVQSRYYWLKFEDNLGNVGNFTDVDGVLGSTTQIQTGDIGAGVITAEKFAAGVTAIEIVTSLPTVGNYVGRTVTLTSDGNLYTWDGDSWERVAPDIDTGIDNVDTLPVSGMATDDIVYLTTDKKLYRYNGTTWVPVVGDILPQSVDITKFASGITPVEILGSLPVTGNFEGRQVFTGGKLYRYVSGSFISTVPTTDLTGTISTVQIADGAVSVAKFASTIKPIEIVATLPASGNVAGRTVFLTTDSKIYRYNGTTFVKHVDGADITANSITAGQIATGAISADEIAANAVTASKIFIGDSSNMVPDPTFTDASAFVLGTGTAITLGSSAGASVGSVEFVVNAAETNATTAPINVEGSKPYFVSNRMYASAAQNRSIYIQWFSGSNGSGFISNTLLRSSAGDFKDEQIVTSPSNARSCRIAAYRSAGGTGIVYWTEAIMRRASSGELIVDGAITAVKIAADTITATQIAANAITSNELAANSVIAGKVAAGAITATEIAAKSITASKLFIGDRSNMYPVPDLDDITGWSTTAGSVTTGLASVGWPGVSVASRNIITVIGAAGYTHDYNGTTWGVPVEPNKQYYASAACWTSGSCQVIVNFYSSDGNYVSGSSTNVISNNLGSVTRGSVIMTAPPTAVRMLMMFYHNSGAASYFAEPILRRASSSELIVDGAIVANKIAANAVTASKIYIGDSSNMVPDPTMTDPASWVFNHTGIGIDVTGQVIGSAGLMYFPVNAVETNGTTVSIPVEANKPYYISGYLNQDSGINMMLYVQWFSLSNGTGYISGEQIGARTTTGRVNKIVTAPSNARSCRLAAYRAAGGTGYGYWGEAVMRRASNGELIVDGSISADKIAANAIIAGKIAAGAISAAEISANAITASKLALFGGSALNADPHTADISAWTVGGTITQSFSSSAASGDTIFIAGPSSQLVEKRRIPIDHNKVYRLKGNYRRTGGNGTIYILVSLYDSSGTIITGDGSYWYYPVAGAFPIDNVWQYVSVKFGVGTAKPFPSNAKTMSLGALPNYAGSTGTYELNTLVLEEAVDASLIVDGTITATQIAASAITATQIATNAVTSDKIIAGAITAAKIAANTITATQIAAGTITATEIATNTITAAKMSVSTLSSISANLGTITAGSLNINNKFIVASDGTTTIQNATTGQRLVLTNSVLEVYDSSNVRRIRLGIW